ncbi:ribonuclease H-like domain-containing protein [Tanacetum coccineum]
MNFKTLLIIDNLLSVALHCDNNYAIKIEVNPVFHERTKHLKIDLHFLREKILSGVVKTVKVDTANQIAHILTKGLDTFVSIEVALGSSVKSLRVRGVLVLFLDFPKKGQAPIKGALTSNI